MENINKINLDRIGKVIKAFLNLGVNKFLKNVENEFLADLDPEDKEEIKKLLSVDGNNRKISAPKK